MGVVIDAKRLLPTSNDFPGFLGRVGIMEQLSILRADEAVVFQQLPVDQPVPVLSTDQNDANLFGLEQRQCIEQLVARAKSSGNATNAFARNKKCILRNAKYRN